MNYSRSASFSFLLTIQALACHETAARAFCVPSAGRAQAGRQAGRKGKARASQAGRTQSRTSSRTSSRTQGKPSPKGKGKPDASQAMPSRKRASPTRPAKARLSPIKPLPYRDTAKPDKAQASPARAQERARQARRSRALAGFAGQAGRARRKPSAQAASRKRNAQGRPGGVYRPAEIFARFSTRFHPFSGRTASCYGRKVKPVTGARLTYRAHGCSFTARLLILGADGFLYGRGLILARTARILSARKRWARLHENECR